MAIPHASSGQVIDIRPLGSKLSESITTTLIKTDSLEVIRLVVPAGKEIPPHKVTGEITVQCLEGRIEFNTPQGPKQLQAGEMLYLAGSQEHCVKGIDNSSVLVTILL